MQRIATGTASANGGHGKATSPIGHQQMKQAAGPAEALWISIAINPLVQSALSGVWCAKPRRNGWGSTLADEPYLSSRDPRGEVAQVVVEDEGFASREAAADEAAEALDV